MYDKRIWMWGAIGSGTIVLIMLLAWLLDAFDTQPHNPPISTNQILTQQDELPLVCAETLAVLQCIIAKEPLLSSSYAQLLSERNVITNQEVLSQHCQSYYEYLQAMAQSGSQQLLNGCI